MDIFLLTETLCDVSKVRTRQHKHNLTGAATVTAISLFGSSNLSHVKKINYAKNVKLFTHVTLPAGLCNYFQVQARNYLTCSQC